MSDNSPETGSVFNTGNYQNGRNNIIVQYNDHHHYHYHYHQQQRQPDTSVFEDSAHELDDEEIYTIPSSVSMIPIKNTVNNKNHIHLCTIFSSLNQCGSWKKVHLLFELYRRTYNQEWPHMVDRIIGIICYYCLAASLYGEVDKGKRQLDIARSLLSNSTYRPLMESRIKYTEAYILRREGDLYSACNLLEQAWQMSTWYDMPFYKGAILYHLVCARRQCHDNTLRNHDKDIQMIKKAVDLLSQSDGDLAAPLMLRVQAMIVLIYLNSDTTFSRRRALADGPDMIKCAENIIDGLNGSGQKLYPRYYIKFCEANCYLRQEQYGKARHHAMQALEIANNNNFKSEMSKAYELLDDIDVLRLNRSI